MGKCHDKQIIWLHNIFHKLKIKYNYIYHIIFTWSALFFCILWNKSLEWYIDKQSSPIYNPPNAIVAKLLGVSLVFLNASMTWITLASKSVGASRYPFYMPKIPCLEDKWCCFMPLIP